VSLEGKVAIVTGAGSGLGAAIAAALNRSGATVAAFDINEASAQHTVSTFTAGPEGLAVKVDVSDAEAVKAAIDEVEHRFGRIDVLANNAGIFDGGTETADTSDELWTKVLSVNLNGMFYMARAVVPAILRQGGGAIVMTASVCSVIAGGGGAAYTVSKHGVLGLTRSLAHEYGPRGIRVNAVGPGAMATPMSRDFVTPGSGFDEFARSTVAGRWGEPEEIGSVVAFLADEGASFMHGSLVMADGGYTLR
jgi:3-oxoacyl-[acyl-carrier protein] reductase